MHTAGPAGEDKELKRIIAGLSSSKTVIRVEARAALAQIDSAQVDELVSILRRTSRQRLNRVGLSFPLLLILSWSLFPWMNSGNEGGIPMQARTLIYFGLVAGSFLLFPRDSSMMKRRAAFSYCVTSLKNARMIGPLMSRTRLNPFANNKFLLTDPFAVEPSILAEALNKIGPEEDVDLTSSERRQLRWLLRSSESALVLGLINLLGVVGGTDDLPILQSLANGSYAARNHLEIRQKAAETTDIVTARLNAQRIPDTLLRASQLSTSPETLLRSATPAHDEDCEELLRPTDPASEAGMASQIQAASTGAVEEEAVQGQG